MLAFEMFGGLDGERLAVAIGAKLRARSLREQRHRYLPFPHSSSAWPVDYELGREILERAGASESEIERIMWKNAADIYQLAYDAPETISVAA